MVPFSAKTQLLNKVRQIFMVPAFENILAKLTSGKPPTSLAGRLAPNHYQYKENSLRRVIRDGIHYELDLSDFMQSNIFYQYYEVAREKLFQLATRDGVVIDIGSNIGEVAMKFAQKVGPRGRVVCFEPFPETLKRLKRNLSLNAFENISIVERALGDSPTTFSMKPQPFNSGGNKIVIDQQAGLQIEVSTLDREVESLELKRIDLIKIDTEGFEFKILLGATQTLKKFKPSLFIEVNDAHLRSFGSSALELTKFLKDMGYDLTHAESGRGIDPTQFNFEQCHFDLIAQTSAPRF